jgi:CheY-like chemotaxis protein
MTVPKILAIDDEPALQKAMQKALKNENYDIVFANNGLEGLEQFKKEKPDLILLDLRMPKLDGFEFLEKINLGMHMFPAHTICCVFVFNHILPQDRASAEESFLLAQAQLEQLAVANDRTICLSI